MKNIFTFLFILILLTSCNAKVPDNDLSLEGDSVKIEPENVETYSAIVSVENYMGLTDYWEITNVYAEGTVLSEGFPLKVFYTTEGSRATMLIDFDVSDYPYIGAYIENEDGTFSRDYSKIAEHANLTEKENEFGDICTAAGSYYELTDGSWFFGNVESSSSFFVVVNNDAAAQMGTVPSYGN